MPEDAEDIHRMLYEVLQRRVSKRAYELYQARAGAPGGALDDWLRAEIEILGRSLNAALRARSARAGR